METRQLNPVRNDSLAQVIRPDELERVPEAVALAEVGQAVRTDCRLEPKTYLEEARVSAAGE